MTVQKDVTKNIYVGNGSTRTFPFTFECPAEHPEYIKVYLMQDDGTALATSDYQLDMDARQITYPSSGTALPEGKKLVIMRELPLQQMMNLVNNGPYFAEDVETAFDENVMAMQQIAEKLNRSIIMSVDIDGDAFVNEVPFEAGKSFRIADDGKSIVLTEDPARVLPLAQEAYAQAQAQAQSASASAVAAAKSEDSAAASASEAGNSAQAASASAASAAESAELTSGYKQEALTAKANATASATNAKASEANAKTSENNAEASKEAAQSAASNANNFATSASSSASEAKSYRDAANNYAANAKNYSENVNVFLPSVSDSGVLSWTNKAGLANPASVNIKGAKGDKGDTGAAATIKVGTVTTGAAGSNASVVNRGDANNAILDFVLPKGTDGKGSVITVNGKEPDAGGNVNVANMAGASDSAAGKAGLVPIPTAGKQDMALCGDATFKVLPIAGGGTGANTISAACKALGLDWDWFHRYGLNYVPPDVTNNGWNSLGLCLIYYTEVKIKNQPTTYGQLLNIPAAKHTESTQIWIKQDSGALYFRGGNASDIVNDEVFTRVATEEDVSSAGYGIVAANLAQNGYVKFANGLILQWGYNSKGAVSFPLTFSMLFTPLVTPQQKNGSIGGSYFYFSMLTNSGFSLAYGEIPIYWIAIGR